MNRASELIHGFKTLLNFDNWAQLVIGRIFFRNTSTVVHKKGEMEIVIDYAANEQSGTRFCVGNLMYDCFINAMKLDGKAINVIDAGANGGGFPLMLKVMGYDIGKVLCLEMNPLTYSRLYFNIVRNIEAETAIRQGALCGRTGETKVSLGIGSVSDNLYEKTDKNSKAYNVTVQLYDFDCLYNSFYENDEIIDICKIDIEGAEYEMLFDGSCENLKKCRYIIIELHESKQFKFKDVEDKLSSMGFVHSNVKSPWEDTVFMFENTNI